MLFIFQENLSEELLNKPINLSMPSLKEVKLRAYILEQNQAQFAQFVGLLKKQGVVLEKIVIVPLTFGTPNPPIVLRRRPPRVDVHEAFSLQIEGNPEQ